MCLESVAGQKDPPPFEILVVDNAPSSGATRHLVSGMPGVRYLLEQRPGLSFARNRAVEETQAEVLAFIDDDAVAVPGWLDAVARTFARDARIAVCSGPVVPMELETTAQRLFEARGGFPQSFVRAVHDQTAPDGWTEITWPLLAGALGTGCNLALRVGALREIGSFDPALGAGTPATGGEDLDVVFRMIEAGCHFAYEPAAVLRHRHRADLPGLSRQIESWGRGTVAFLVKSGTTRPRYSLRARRAIFWLLRHHLRRLARSVSHRSAERLPLRLVLLELAGCLRGLRAYGISRRYVRQVEASAAAPPRSSEREP
jgi:cellulose synthase/poly-beta-1,6-N-acetylglucosamine synthase-like glycosyltransferase